MRLLENEVISMHTYALVLEKFIGRAYNSYRELLQIIGTDLFRNEINNNYWCEEFTKSLCNDIDMVVTDVRFENERKAIKDAGGTLILIERASQSEDTHASENSLGNRSDYDFIIDNNSSEEDLRVAMLMCYDTISSKN